MNVREILDTAVGYLGLENLTFSLDCPVVLSDSRAIKLMRAANLVVSEIASEYFPLLKEENIETENGIIEYTTLSERLLDVISLKNSSGENVRFKLFPTYLKTREGGEFTLTYQYMPPTLDVTSALPYDIKISPRLFALGICSEYCLLSGMYEEGVMFDKKYREAIRAALSFKGEHKVASRRW